MKTIILLSLTLLFILSPFTIAQTGGAGGGSGGTSGGSTCTTTNGKSTICQGSEVWDMVYEKKFNIKTGKDEVKRVPRLRYAKSDAPMSDLCSLATQLAKENGANLCTQKNSDKKCPTGKACLAGACDEKTIKTTKETHWIDPDCCTVTIDCACTEEIFVCSVKSATTRDTRE